MLGSRDNEIERRNGMLKKSFAVFIAFIMLFSVIVCSADETGVSEAAESRADGYELICENGGYALQADLKTGDFSLTVLSSGDTWRSGQWNVLDEESEAYAQTAGRLRTDLVSVIGVNYVQASTIASTAVPSYQNSYAYSVKRNNVRVEKIKNGFRAEYTFSDIEATVPVEITLTESGLKAQIKGGEIKTGKEYYITSVELLPGFTAAVNGENGYLFVPSGSGALVDIGSGRGDLSSYSEMVYGDDAAIEKEEYTGREQNITVPVYGIKRGETAVAAVITGADSQARINAESNSPASAYTRVFSEYITAIVDSTTLFESDYSNQRIIYGIEKRKKLEDYTVEFSFLSGAAANYSGMAGVYRDYLGLTSKSEKPQLYITLYGAAAKKASFLGIPYTKTISLTSFSEAADILSELNGEGIPAALRYIGWNNSGIENKKVMTKLSPVGVLGGKKGFKKLFAAGEKNGNSVYFDLDFMSIRRSGNGFSALSDVSKSIFGTRTPQYKYMRSVYVPVNNENPWYLLTPENFKKAADKFFSRYSYSGGVSLSGVGETLYSDFKNNACERSQTVEYYGEVLKNAGKNRRVAVSTGNAYTYKYVNGIYSLPSTSDGNLIFSKDVPFVQMVLHGAVSYGAESGNTLLDCLEYGANPYYFGIASDDAGLIETTFNWLGGTTVSNWISQAKSQFKEFSDVYSQLYDKKIVSHESENGVSKTVFENGTAVYVNRGENEVKIGNDTVSPGGYLVTGGKTE